MSVDQWVKTASISELVDWLEDGARVAVAAYRDEDVDRVIDAVLEEGERRELHTMRGSHDRRRVNLLEPGAGSVAPGFVVGLVGGYLRPMPVDRIVGPFGACQSVGLIPRVAQEPAR